MPVTINLSCCPEESIKCSTIESFSPCYLATSNIAAHPLSTGGTGHQIAPYLL